MRAFAEGFQAFASFQKLRSFSRKEKRSGKKGSGSGSRKGSGKHGRKSERKGKAKRRSESVSGFQIGKQSPVDFTRSILANGVIDASHRINRKPAIVAWDQSFFSVAQSARESRKASLLGLTAQSAITAPSADLLLPQLTLGPWVKIIFCLDSCLLLRKGQKVRKGSITEKEGH